MYRLLVLETDRMTPERIFARRMKRERTRRKWRQEDLARQLSTLGLDLHPSAIAKMEREPDPDKSIEPRSIRLDEAAVIARAFSLGVDDMLSDNDIGALEVEAARLEAELHEAVALMVQVEDARSLAVARYEQLTHKVSEARRRIAQLEHIRYEKHAAIEAGDFDRAARARHEERKLIDGPGRPITPTQAARPK